VTGRYKKVQVIPAVDIRGGRCVRLLQGDFSKETVFANSPIEMALHWELMGAERLHVVDLDGARTGRPQNAELIGSIVDEINIPVQVGGGIRSIKTAEMLLDLGVDRIIIGTSAALDTDFAEEMFSNFGESVILGLDAINGMVATHGWQETTDIDAIKFAQQMVELGARRIIHTDISTDGMLKGVNLDAMEAMASAVDIPVIASGGVTNLQDIQELRKLEPLGIEGVIAGKALYTNSLNLKAAIAAAR
jgi:phosphoribosylformimino-5-aminoimidazole carboxamide ribotide isomerase